MLLAHVLHLLTIVMQQQAQALRMAADAQSYQRRLNVACNDVVKTILNADVSVQDVEVQAVKARLLRDRELLTLADDPQSQLFFDSIVCVCDHTLHPQVGSLKGFYANAWNTVLKYVEDAGWQITEPPFVIAG
jgi:hypothetical protein